MSLLLPIDCNDDLQNDDVVKSLSTRRRREHAYSEFFVITEKIGADVCVQSTRLCVRLRLCARSWCDA